MKLNDFQNHALAKLARLEHRASTAAIGRAVDMIHGEEVACLIKYSRGAMGCKAYWTRNGDRVAYRRLKRFFLHLCGQE